MDDRVSTFIKIEKLLFKALILEKHKVPQTEFGVENFGSKASEFIEAEIDPDIDRLSILSSDRKQGKASQWIEQTIEKKDYAAVSLKFIDFFDWHPNNQKGKSSWPYTRVEVRINKYEEPNFEWLISNENISSFYLTFTA